MRLAAQAELREYQQAIGSLDRPICVSTARLRLAGRADLSVEVSSPQRAAACLEALARDARAPVAQVHQRVEDPLAPPLLADAQLEQVLLARGEGYEHLQTDGIST